MKLNTLKIKKELGRLGITQSEFADKIGITRQGLWWILTNETTTFNTLNKIADVLDVDAKDLVK